MGDVVLLVWDAPGFMTTDVMVAAYPSMDALKADFALGPNKLGWDKYVALRDRARDWEELDDDGLDQLIEDLGEHGWNLNEDNGLIYRDEPPDYTEHDVLNFVARELSWGEDYMVLGQGMI